MIQSKKNEKALIKPSYVIAARGLLGWKQGDLARLCGVSTRTINLYESQKHNPSQDTLIAIEMAFDRAGVAFKNNGLFLEDRRMLTLDGPNRLRLLFDDIEFTLQGHGEILIDGADESKTPFPIVDKVQLLRKKGMKMRHLIQHGDRFMRGHVEEYRWLPTASFINQSIFIYGESIAIVSEEEPRIFVHRNSSLAVFMRRRFDLLWNILEQPDYTEAQDVFEI